jgi:transglutaminase-like putative cysteine protease
MSAGAAGPAGPITINVAARFAPADAHGSGRPSPLVARLIRVVAFAALGGYGVIRWATLLHPAATGRLLGLLGLSVAIVTLVPLLQERLGRPPAVMAAALLCLLALPVAGLNWHDFLHLRIAASAHAVGDGLSGLPASFVPYAGASHDIRTVIALGAAVLLLDGAVVLAFAPSLLGDARRAGAALPLIALAIVPSTLLRPELPYLQGFVLFVLLVAFVWGERAHGHGRRLALVLLAVAGLAAGMIAPRLDTHHAWLDYRAWTGNLSRAHLDQFVWNQRYGPLHWPRSGHVVFTVAAAHADYWKAEDLDVFNGYGWVSAPVSATSLPAPSPAALAKWSQTIDVSVSAMRSSAVIASGLAAAPILPGGVRPGAGEGTWVSYRSLGPGSHYSVQTYSPHPSPVQLNRARGGYPTAGVRPYRSMTVPASGVPPARYPTVHFAPFRAGRSPSVQSNARALAASAYAPMFALAQRLAAGAHTPYAYATAVLRYLDAHFAYNESPPARRYPLVSFLFKDKIGYCQQFSGAMALLLRMGGVPARVAAGFTSGSRDIHKRFAVTDIDAHAWVEAWFPRYGWVRFDPTPGAAPARGGNASAGIVKNLPGSIGTGAAAPRRDAQTSVTGSAGAGHRHATGTSPWLLLPAGLLVILGGLLFALVAAAEPGPEQQLRELERALARTGRPLGPEVTLAALERRFRDSPAAAAYIRGLRLGRYAGLAPEVVPGGRRALREQLRRGLGMTGRLRALWALPPRAQRARRRRWRRRGRH